VRVGPPAPLQPTKVTPVNTSATSFLQHEAHALLARLQRIRPFALSETMVPAANLAPAAQRAIDHHLATGRELLRRQAIEFIGSLRDDEPANQAQRRFALLRLRFQASLSQFDLFADALAQRGERDHGVWMAGLDALAADALAMPAHYRSPPVVCYLDRGIGAAIRRARTRLPGGGENPAALIRVPRERMVGGGIASSLVHEVGHQAAALLGLLDTLRPMLRRHARHDDRWGWWERWISEIVADLWSVARLSVAATVGMIGVLSLPRPFVFRIGADDPHPAPWIRVLLCCAIGHALYPDAAWSRLAGLWRVLYPLDGLGGRQRALLLRLADGIDDFVDALLGHRPPAFEGRSIATVLHDDALQARTLRATLASTAAAPSTLLALRPCLASALLGQARTDERLSPQAESRWLARLLTHWALRNALTADPQDRQFIPTA